MIPHRTRILLLLIIPILMDCCVAHKSYERRRRKPLDINSGRGTMHPMGDQIALANSWQSSNRVISASYTGNPDTGLVDHANFVVNLLPAQRTPQPSAKDLAIAEQLANTRTASEYVNEAMRMRYNRHLKVPQSSYIKYDVYEKQKTKLFRPSSEEANEDESFEYNQINPPAIKYIVGSNEKEARPLLPPVATTRTSNHYTDFIHSPRKPDYHNSETFGGHAAGGQLYTSYGTTYKNHYDTESKDSSSQESEEETKKKAHLPKHELIKHIQQSVIKYMQELEAEGKFTPTPTQSAPVIVKTYYRFPTSTPSPEELHNDYVKSKLRYVESSDGPTEYFKYSSKATPSPSTYDQSHIPESSNDLYPSTSMTPPTYHSQHAEDSPTPNIDLTFHSKARPKPIDLDALDVGQSWSHDAEQNTENHKTPIIHSKRKLPKTNEPLNFDAQTYHDINSMDMSKTKSNSQKKNRKPNSSQDHQHVTPVRFKDESHSTIHDNDGAAPAVFNGDAINEVQKHYRSQIHVINGIPVLNPYRLNLHQLNELFGDPKEHRTQDESESNETKSSAEKHQKEMGWMPSFSPIPSFTNVVRKPDLMSYNSSKPKQSKTSTFHHNLPYDSYNPKYNNNPEGVGYQDDYRTSDLDETSHIEPISSSDLYSSSTSKRSKKSKPPTGHPTVSSKAKKNVKRPGFTTSYNDKIRSKLGGVKNRVPETDLRPPRPS